MVYTLAQAPYVASEMRVRALFLNYVRIHAVAMSTRVRHTAAVAGKILLAETCPAVAVVAHELNLQQSV